MTALVKRKPKPLPLVDAMAVPVSAVPAQSATADQAAPASVAAIAWVTVARVAKAAISAKTGVRAWVMPLSVRSAKPWNVPKCRCASWPHKPTAKH